ncbi:hypothetical protein LCGC14_1166690 [marine sediment metagenome]|uniref:Uncharacterized protein n=1 Tax=marine sediment metagenome TaxID=412755 RepID=A0A0F9ME19_9ZZZZ
MVQPRGCPLLMMAAAFRGQLPVEGDDGPGGPSPIVDAPPTACAGEACQWWEHCSKKEG